MVQIDMARAEQKNTLAETLKIIETQLSELRQTESLESQVHEMTLAKRHRLDALMTDFVELANAALTVVGESIAREVVVEQIVEPVVEEMKLAALPALVAPEDLFSVAPTPTAQHVLDSLNRLMGGIKSGSSKQAAA